VRERGCQGCHAIPGMETASKIGPDLTRFSIKKEFELSFGNVVNEALWCGIPAVALDDRMGVAHQIANEVNGFLVEPDHENTDEEFASACLLLSRSSTLRQQMGEQGANLSRRSSHPDIVISRFEAIYERAREHCRSTVPSPLANASRMAQLRSFAFHIGRWAMWNTASLGIAYTATAIGAGRRNGAEQNAEVQSLMKRRQAQAQQRDAA
ncbi:MAG: glycosyltransferase, partial [Myxococcota bacterium]|nr:glycosyltransferase [Myxococcota bacterium]